MTPSVALAERKFTRKQDDVVDEANVFSDMFDNIQIINNRSEHFLLRDVLSNSKKKKTN